MKLQIELEHPRLERAKLLVNDVSVGDETCNKSWMREVTISRKQRLQVWFWPWKIKPLLRINGHLVDYGLAKVDQYDHMLEFDIDKNFFDFYGKQLVNSRIQSQFPDGKIDQNIYDAVIGYGKRHQDLLDRIKEMIQS